MNNARSLLRRAAAEPLLQFLLCGAILLLIQSSRTPAQPPSLDSTIRISQAAVTAMRADFERERNRAPSAGEIQQMIDRRIESEVLYREAVRLGLDRSDVIVRREMQRKMRFLIEDVSRIAPPTEAEQAQWLAEHQDRYIHPVRVQVQQVFLSRARHGAQIDQVATTVRQRLIDGNADFRSLSDPFIGGLTFDHADQTELSKHFGGAVAQSILQQTTGEWGKPLRSGLGVHLIRVVAREEATPMTLAEAGQALVNDLMETRREEMNRAAIAALRARYLVHVDA